MTAQEKVRRCLEEMIEDADTPGVQYMMLSADSILFSFTGGLADLEQQSSFSDSTTLHAFSVTKTFTALAVLQLEEAGKINLDDPVQNYVPDLPYKITFTIHQLLNHTSGLPNPIPLRWVHLLDEHPGFDYSAFIDEVLTENDELDNQPGENFSYSNVGYLILGRLIEKVSGEDYRSYIQRHIIDSLSLSPPAYLGFEIPDTAKHAHGYIKKWSFLNLGLNFVFDKGKFMNGSYDGWTQFNYFYLNGYAYGGLIGNAQGFAAYLQTLLKHDRLVSDRQKAKLFKSQQTLDGETQEYCLGWYRGKLINETYYAHAGGGGGYYCEIRLYPSRKMASVIMLNRTGVSDKRILDNLDTFFL